jgi:hypothetical protein
MLLKLWSHNQDILHPDMELTAPYQGSHQVCTHTCMSYEVEDTCMSYEEEDTWN